MNFTEGRTDGVWHCSFRSVSGWSLVLISGILGDLHKRNTRLDQVQLGFMEGCDVTFMAVMYVPRRRCEETRHARLREVTGKGLGLKPKLANPC